MGDARFAGSVTATAVQVLASAAVRITPRSASRGSVSVFNNGPNAIFVGPDNTVTTATGFPIPAGTAKEFDETGAELWARAVTADQVSPADTRVFVS